MHLSEAFWTVYIYHWLSISGCHTISIYIYTSPTSQVKSRTGTFLVWLMQVRLEVKQAPIKHYIPSDKVLAWRYIDHKSLLITCLTHSFINSLLVYEALVRIKIAIYLYNTEFLGGMKHLYNVTHQIYFSKNKQRKNYNLLIFSTILISISIRKIKAPAYNFFLSKNTWYLKCIFGANFVQF